MDIRDFAGLGGIPLVLALVALLKRTVPSLSSRYYPGASVAFGVVVNLGVVAIIGGDWKIAVFVGVITGMMASGLFVLGKSGESVTTLETKRTTSTVAPSVTETTVTTTPMATETPHG